MTKPSSLFAKKKQLLSRIAAAQKQADAGKRAAKLAKLGLRNAKQKFKDAKHAARKLRKAVKALKAELAALGTKQPRRKSAVKKPAGKRIPPPPAPAPAPVETAPVFPVAAVPAPVTDQ